MTMSRYLNENNNTLIAYCEAKDIQLQQMDQYVGLLRKASFDLLDPELIMEFERRIEEGLSL